MPKTNVSTDDLEIDVKDGYALIDMCEEHDTPILFGFRDGACGAYMVRVKEGSDKLSPIQDDEKYFLEIMDADPDERISCQCKVHVDVVLEVSE